jgi:hypothetical protein
MIHVIINLFVGGIQHQMHGHKKTTFYGTLSCVPFEHSPWPYYLAKPTFLGLEERDLEHMHNTNNMQHR